jgi:tRNA uridine 5-carbamoylmethylation protein Kti12
MATCVMMPNENAAATSDDHVEVHDDEPVKFASLSYEQRRQIVKSRQHAVQQRRLSELIAAQRVAHEMYERLQRERRERIEELRRREEERRKAVLDRREKLVETYKVLMYNIHMDTGRLS